MTCKYCTPNKQGHRKPLNIDKYLMPKYRDVGRYKRNITKIYREKKYFIGTHSMDVSQDGKVMFRNNGFIMKRQINFCPMCARNLQTKINNKKEKDD